MVKFDGNPIFSCSTLKIFAKTEWNVPIHIFLALSSPTINEILSFISCAALLVKVRDNMLKGSISFSIR